MSVDDMSEGSDEAAEADSGTEADAGSEDASSEADSGAEADAGSEDASAEADSGAEDTSAEADAGSEDAAAADSGTYDWRQDPSIPTPESDGYTLGMDACLDQCWADFHRCLDTTTNPQECIARLEACKRGCA